MSRVTFFFMNNWIRLLITFVLGLSLMTVYNFTAGSWTSLISYSNGAFIAGFVWFSIGVLFIVESFGGFDIFVYLPRRKKDSNGHIENLYEYSERRKSERKKGQFGFLAYFLQSAFFILASLIMLIFVYAQYIHPHKLKMFVHAKNVDIFSFEYKIIPNY